MRLDKLTEMQIDALRETGSIGAGLSKGFFVVGSAYTRKLASLSRRHEELASPKRGSQAERRHIWHCCRAGIGFCWFCRCHLGRIPQDAGAD